MLKIKAQIKQWRIQLANWIWPKDVKEGELFTIVKWVKIPQDGSWIGDTLRAESVEGTIIRFSEYNRHTQRFNKINCSLSIGDGVIVKPLSRHQTEIETRTMYEAVKKGLA